MPPDPHPAIVEIHTTFPSRDEAERCGRKLVEDRLAACVQVAGPVTSIYRWSGAIETAAEFRCTCKTTAARAADCCAAIRGLHPYDVPEILSVMCTASADYARWVEESVSP